MQTMGKIARVLPANPEKVLKAKNQLLSDLSDLVTDAEQLLASTAEYSGDTIAGARSKFKGSLDQFKTRVTDAQSSAINQFDSAAAATQQYAHDNPWKVAGVAALAGALLSALLTNSRRYTASVERYNRVAASATRRGVVCFFFGREPARYLLSIHQRCFASADH